MKKGSPEAALTPEGSRKLAGGASHRISLEKYMRPGGVPDPYALDSSIPSLPRGVFDQGP